MKSQPSDKRKSEAAEPETGFRAKWLGFWFGPSDPIGLQVVRVLAGLVFLAWLLPFAGNADSYFGLGGWMDRQAYQEANQLRKELQSQTPPQDIPAAPMNWSLLYSFLGDSSAAVHAVYWISLVILVLFILGLWTRVTSILTWIIICSFSASPAIDYGGDALLRILAFYLMIGHVLIGLRDPELSWGERILGSNKRWLFHRFFKPSAGHEEPSMGANLAMRLIQVHLVIVILTSVLHKLQHGDWWSGMALWYPLYPAFETTLAQARFHLNDTESYFRVLSLGAYAVLAWQLAFPLFAWRQGWMRLVLLGGAAIGWLGCSFMYGLPLYGPAIFVGCLCFVTGTEWRRLFDGVGRIPVVQQWKDRFLPAVVLEEMPSEQAAEEKAEPAPEPSGSETNNKDESSESLEPVGQQ